MINICCCFPKDVSLKGTYHLCGTRGKLSRIAPIKNNRSNEGFVFSCGTFFVLSRDTKGKSAVLTALILHCTCSVPSLLSPDNGPDV